MRMRRRSWWLFVRRRSLQLSLGCGLILIVTMELLGLMKASSNRLHVPPSDVRSSVNFFTFSGLTQTDLRARDTIDSSQVSTNDTMKQADGSASGNKDQPRVFYTVARTDRSGASILDMIEALAYGFAKKMTYGGACYRKPMTELDLEWKRNKEELIQALGLNHLLVFACPKNNESEEVLQPKQYRAYRELGYLKQKFVKWVRSQAKYLKPYRGVVVHIRRGDYTPCGPLIDRYLPSSHYLDILNRYIPPDLPVTIFSESVTFEPWTEFSNYTLRLDSELPDVWKAIMTAQYVILSSSSFSYVPAILNRNTVYFTPLRKKGLPGWIEVSDDIVKRSRERVQQLVREQCNASNPM